MDAKPPLELPKWKPRLRAVTTTVEAKKRLASHLGVTLPAIYHYLSGQMSPSLETLQKLFQWVRQEEETRQTTKTKSRESVGAQSRRRTQNATYVKANKSNPKNG